MTGLVVFKLSFCLRLRAPSNFPDPGIKEFDPNQDEIWKEEFLGGVDGKKIFDWITSL